MEVPPQLRTYAPSRWGADATRWVEELPDVVASLAADWGLGPVTPAADSNRSFVGVTRVAGRLAYLKVEYDPEWQAAADTLDRWSRHRASPAVLARCEVRKATLIADAGTITSTVTTQLSHDVGGLLTVTHRLPPAASVTTRSGAGAASVETACERFDQLTSPPFPRDLLARPLPQPSHPPVTLHGDLTVRNVCRGPDGRLRFIDPDPRVGPAELDTVQWALRAEDGARWRAHLAAVSSGRLDVPLAEALVPHLCRTYVLYLLATRRRVPPIPLELAQQETVPL